MNDRSKPGTETDARIDENATPSQPQPASRNPADADPGTGLPPGEHDDRSPLDPGMPLDPFGGRGAR